MQQARPTNLWLVALVVAGISAAVFSRTLFNDFVNFDDYDYVAVNPRVKNGLTWNNFLWALTSDVGANWHPLTVLSHQLDAHVYGVQKAWGHHLSNLLLHTANTALLVIVLGRMTGTVWPAALVGALFGLHPLHVESVAWVAERKDVLSTFFWFLSLWAYWHYAGRPTVGRYLLVALLMTLGLLSKPMVVTAPCLMLVLDHWPLRRILGPAATRRDNLRQAIVLFIEKLPLFAIVAAFSVITYFTQAPSGVRSLEALPLKWRIYNTLASYGDYIVQFLAPHGLAVFYPHPTVAIQIPRVVAATLVLIVVSALALLWRRQRPWFITGWLWYVGTLVPVIGLVQVGGAARADRYMYVPLVGLAIIVAGLLAEIAQRTNLRRPLVAGVAVWLAFLAGYSWWQQGYWKNTMTLFTHAAEVASPERNALAHYGMGAALNRQDRYEEAIEEFKKSLQMNPTDGKAMFSMGTSYFRLQRFEEAVDTILEAIDLGDDGVPQRFFLGRALFQCGRYDEAVEQYQILLEQYAESGSSDEPTEAVIEMAVALAAGERYDEAVEVYQERLAELPNNIHYLVEFSWLLSTAPDALKRDERRALELAKRAIAILNRLHQQDTRAWDVGAAALAANHHYGEASQYAGDALERGRTMLDNVEEAIAARPHRAEWEDTPESYRRLLKQMVDGIEKRLELYRDGRPYYHDFTQGRY